MRKTLYALLSTVSAIVLVGGYYLSFHDAAEATADAAQPESGAAPATSSPPSSSPLSSSSSSPTTSAPQASAPAPTTPSETTPVPAPQPSSRSGLADGSYTGTAASTRYGPVQVAITVSGGKITAVQVPVYPNTSGRDQRINAQALPVLVQGTLDAQSASIDMVSGATYTSQGYLASLQSALDQAGA